MTKFSPGPSWPISGPLEPPIRAQTVISKNFSKNSPIYDWNPDNFGRLVRSERALLGPEIVPGTSNMGPNNLLMVREHIMNRKFRP